MGNMIGDEAYDIITDKITEFNKNSKKINYFPIFESETILYDRNGQNMEIKVLSPEKMARELSVSNDAKININLNIGSDVKWIINTLDNMINKQILILKTAKEYAKPETGLFVYDENTDKYFMDSSKQTLISQHNELQHAMTLAQWNSFKFFKYLRNLYSLADFTHELDHLSNEEILDKIKQTIKEVNKDYKILSKIESIPKWHIEIFTQAESISVSFVLNTSIQNYFSDLPIKDKSSIMRANINDTYELKNLYQFVSLLANVNNTLLELARKLITSSSPRWYTQNVRNNNWYLTEDGKKMFEVININTFLEL